MERFSSLLFLLSLAASAPAVASAWGGWFRGAAPTGASGFLSSAPKASSAGAPLRSAVADASLMPLQDVRWQDDADAPESLRDAPDQGLKSVSKKNASLAAAQSDDAANASAPEAAKTSRPVLQSWEAMLITNVATGDDEDAQPCIAHCRYGEEVRHSWQECVERCVEDDLTRRMLVAGLPESERAAPALSAEAPAGIEELKRKRTARRARGEEL
eukprot:TRINITY_DN13241_c0_g1_i2.p1 TRINITY_DN13241_c0_g1~~TRINITY_DN13241_c0_g1_i2.p1  ORF type:complete len:215 (+),score=50.91 TRINITY_DN13241_c0_g1_i2:59-703(+)